MSVYDEIEIEDLDFDAQEQMFYYPCPCGDRFQIALEQIKDGCDIAQCPSCSLQIRVIFDENSYEIFHKQALKETKVC